MKLYSYSKCSTCIKALKYARSVLQKKGADFEVCDIVETPPTQKELKQMLEILKSKGGDLKDLFNTSGVQYRELKMSEKLKEGLSEAEAIKLLAGNGKLIKRPFLLTKKDGTVGFKEEQWKKILSAAN